MTIVTIITPKLMVSSIFDFSKTQINTDEKQATIVPDSSLVVHRNLRERRIRATDIEGMRQFVHLLQPMMDIWDDRNVYTCDYWKEA